MKRYELVQMVDGEKFRATLARAKISDAEKLQIIKDRSEWLWNTYKPSDDELEYTKRRIRRKEEW